ncbi:MAG: NAD-binding protein [Chloroflexi bacterium]|nr:NAD-binding protein [Chloroflexota bacterium]
MAEQAQLVVRPQGSRSTSTPAGTTSAQRRWEQLSARERLRRVIRREWRRLGVRAAISATIIVGGSAFLMYLLEHDRNELYTTPWDGLWWALVTMTTTGYGDIVPKSFEGRLLGGFTVVAGMGLFSVLTALIASVFVTESLKEARGLETVKARGHVIIAGWNWAAEQVVESVADLYGPDKVRVVLVNQLPEESVNEILFKYRDLDIRFVRGDFTQETVLERANIAGASAAIVLADTTSSTSARADERTVLACLAMKHLNPEVRVTGELLDAQNASHLKQASADEIVVAGEFNSFLLATSAATPGVPQAVRALMAPDSPTLLRKMPLPSRFVNHTFDELAAWLRQDQGLLAIGVVTETRGLTLADVLSADYTSVDDFIQRKFSEAGLEIGALAQTAVQVNPPSSYVLRAEDSVLVLGFRD